MKYLHRVKARITVYDPDRLVTAMNDHTGEILEGPYYRIVQAISQRQRITGTWKISHLERPSDGDD